MIIDRDEQCNNLILVNEFLLFIQDTPVENKHCLE